eukprot:6179059-Pleurochrysis_carterae.AAC.3
MRAAHACREARVGCAERTDQRLEHAALRTRTAYRHEYEASGTRSLELVGAPRKGRRTARSETRQHAPEVCEN